MDLAKYLKEKKRLDPERAVAYALDIARYIVNSFACIVYPYFQTPVAIMNAVGHFFSLFDKYYIKLCFALFPRNRGMNYLHENKPPVIHRDLKPR